MHIRKSSITLRTLSVYNLLYRNINVISYELIFDVIITLYEILRSSF